MPSTAKESYITCGIRATCMPCSSTKHPQLLQLICVIVCAALRISVQMGALDGKRFSNTHWYHTHLAWHGVLIEGNPNSFAQLEKNRPNDILVHAAACGERQKVHFASTPESAVSGIEE